MSEIRAAEILRELDRTPREDRRILAEIKRFEELMAGDPEIRQAVVDGRGSEALASRGLTLDPNELRPLYDIDCQQDWIEGSLARWPLVRLWKERCDQILRCRALLRQEIGAGLEDARFRAWRERQIRRNDSELGADNEAITYPLLTFELSRGCTVGCWFCGVAAEDFEANFQYTPENARLWREVLAAFVDLLGEGARSGFCFWATDPMDNPDYPRFIEDYHRITDAMPQTTTAVPLRNLALTRETMELQRRHRTVLNRFSITTLETLRAVHRTFSPEELLDIEIIPQHKEALFRKALAGKALTSYRKLEERGKEQRLPHLGEPYGTIACVAGFLVNMVERSVRLISPCRASADYPKGYIVYARATFADAADLHRACGRIIEKKMPERLDPDTPLLFRSDLEYSELTDGFALHSRTSAHSLSGKPYLRQLGRLIASAEHTAATAESALLEGGADFFAIRQNLSELFATGLLADPLARPESPSPPERLFVLGNRDGFGSPAEANGGAVIEELS